MADCQLDGLMASIEGTRIDWISSFHGLHQLITEPTYLMEESAAYIDLIFTNQPNLFIGSGVHPPLHTSLSCILITKRVTKKKSRNPLKIVIGKTCFKIQINMYQFSTKLIYLIYFIYI